MSEIADGPSCIIQSHVATWLVIMECVRNRILSHIRRAWPGSPVRGAIYAARCQLRRAGIGLREAIVAETATLRHCCPRPSAVRYPLAA